MLLTNKIYVNYTSTCNQHSITPLFNFVCSIIIHRTKVSVNQPGVSHQTPEIQTKLQFSNWIIQTVNCHLSSKHSHTPSSYLIQPRRNKTFQSTSFKQITLYRSDYNFVLNYVCPHTDNTLQRAAPQCGVSWPRGQSVDGATKPLICWFWLFCLFFFVSHDCVEIVFQKPQNVHTHATPPAGCGEIYTFAACYDCMVSTHLKKNHWRSIVMRNCA